MGLEGCKAQLYDSCTDFLQACINTGKNESDANIFKHYNYTFDFQNVKKQLDTAKQLHDHRLDRIGEKSHTHRCHKLPFDEKLRKKKKFKRPKVHITYIQKSFFEPSDHHIEKRIKFDF